MSGESVSILDSFSMELTLTHEYGDEAIIQPKSLGMPAPISKCLDLSPVSTCDFNFMLRQQIDDGQMVWFPITM